MTALPVILPLVVCACTADRAPNPPTDDGLVVPSSGVPSDKPSGERTLSGTLGFDAVEAGCAYVETDDGRRYQVIYPEGWQLDRGSGELSGPGGRRILPGGPVRLRGSLDSGTSSTCQLGSVFRASAVLGPDE